MFSTSGLVRRVLTPRTEMKRHEFIGFFCRHSRPKAEAVPEGLVENLHGVPLLAGQPDLRRVQFERAHQSRHVSLPACRLELLKPEIEQGFQFLAMVGRPLGPLPRHGGDHCQTHSNIVVDMGEVEEAGEAGERQQSQFHPQRFAEQHQHADDGGGSDEKTTGVQGQRPLQYIGGDADMHRRRHQEILQKTSVPGSSGQEPTAGGRRSLQDLGARLRYDRGAGAEGRLRQR
jgi:hypothetical protein